MRYGWIPLYRQIQEHWLWEDKPFSSGQAWIDLLMLANHAEKKVLIGKELVTVPPGSLISSEPKLAERWGWSRTKVRKFLTLLQEDKMLVKETDNKKTTLTLVNYEVYGFLETAEEQQKNIKRTAEEQQKNTNNNVNNINNIKNIKKKDTTNVVSKEKAERFSPPTLDDVKAYCQEKGLSNVDPEKFVDFYSSKGWMVGKNKMKDWKAAVRNWSRSQRQETTAKTTRKEMVPGWMKTKFNNFETRPYNYDELELEMVEQTVRKADALKSCSVGKADDPDLQERVRKLKERLQNN